MKRLIGTLLAALFVCALLLGCGGSQEPEVKDVPIATQEAVKDAAEGSAKQAESLAEEVANTAEEAEEEGS
jgi:hypothetical protein